MPRRPRRPPSRPQPSSHSSATPERTDRLRAAETAPAGPRGDDDTARDASFWSPLRLTLAVVLLLAVHASLAVRSLLPENPTIDEVVHMPAGVTYWQKGTFQLYPHNPPLVKLIAALPVVGWSGVETEELYQRLSWRNGDHSTFAHEFARLNAERYFELFTQARLMMPLFSLVGGVVVFLWSRRLYGPGGGLLSLALWVLCPNVLAHTRLVTTDMGATALGVAATYIFWHYLRQPRWPWAIAAGLALGLAQLTKFSALLLFGLWPVLWGIRVVFDADRADRLRRAGRFATHFAAMVALSVLTINVGYGLEGVGDPLGRFDFGSRTLTRARVPGDPPPRSSLNPLLDAALRERINRFRGTWLESLPTPLPRFYLRGFDEQKIEAEGVPLRWVLAPGSLVPAGMDPNQTVTYPVYLNGELRRQGWWYYYLYTLAVKVPEGTWLLVGLSLVVLAVSKRSRASWADELTLWVVPITVLGVMSFGTDINLGLRYVLPIFPYVFISVGKLVPWAMGLGPSRRGLAVLVVSVPLAWTSLATAMIHPHYLAYFNGVSGGPDRDPPHLIDSNLDWGQDLLRLRAWRERNAPDEPIGLVYFGQIHPNVLRLADRDFDWFLPPALPEGMRAMPGGLGAARQGPAPRLTPGLYAVSVTMLHGLPWRLYDPALLDIYPAWNAQEHAFAYFRELPPITHVGHSIKIYRLDQDDVARLSRYWPGAE